VSRRPWRWLAALGLMTLSCLPARADEIESQQLYQQALLSIAEGRKNDASETLSRVIEQEPLHAGAWLDLALIQCALGHAEEADRLFSTIEQRFNPPPGIREVITDARQGGCSKWQASSRGSFSFGRGISQNVNQGASRPTYGVIDGGVPIELPLLPEFLPQHDQYSAVTADYQRDLTPNGTTGYAQMQERRYDSLHQYNSTALLVGVDTPWRFGQWTLRSAANLDFVTLGGQLYQRQVQVQARVGPPLPLPNSMQFNFGVTLSHLEYLTLDNFNANTGEVRGQFTYRKEDSSVSLSAAWLSDHALAARPGGDRQGWQFQLQGRRRLVGDVSGELAYSHQNWRSSSVYALNFIDVVRKQTTHVLRAALTYPINRSQSLLLEGRAVQNQENISIFQYNDRQLQLSWLWQWP
jgi:hypothetical protein